MIDYDSQLLVSAGSGSQAALRELFDRNYARAVRLAYRFLGDNDAAEDIAMDAFVSIQKSSHSYKPKAKFSTYLYRVVLNLCINHSKRSKRVRHEPIERLAEYKDPHSDPAKSVEQDQVSADVRKAVLALPENQRTALVLTRYEDLSYEDAARVMGVSVGAVESLLHRAKENLRKALSEYIA